MKITKCEPCYTGGGIYVFMGNTDMGYFIADSFYDIDIVDIDPFETEDPYDTPFWSDWREEHLVKTLSGDKAALTFMYEILDWVKVNEPDGNYAMSELEIMQDEVNELLETCYDDNGNEIVQWR